MGWRENYAYRAPISPSTKQKRRPLTSTSGDPALSLLSLNPVDIFFTSALVGGVKSMEALERFYIDHGIDCKEVKRSTPRYIRINPRCRDSFNKEAFLKEVEGATLTREKVGCVPSEQCKSLTNPYMHTVVHRGFLLPAHYCVYC